MKHSRAQTKLTLFITSSEKKASTWVWPTETSQTSSPHSPTSRLFTSTLMGLLFNMYPCWRSIIVGFYGFTFSILSNRIFCRPLLFFEAATPHFVSVSFNNPTIKHLCLSLAAAVKPDTVCLSSGGGGSVVFLRHISPFLELQSLPQASLHFSLF